MRLRRFLWIAAFLTFTSALGACARGEPDRSPIEVRVERLPEARAFKVTWSVPKVSSSIVFSRSGGFRLANWKPTIDGQRFEKKHGREILVAEKPSSTFQVLIPERYYEGAGDYPLLTEFSGGDVLLYSGYFEAAPIDCYQKCTEEDVRRGLNPSPTTLVFVPAKGEAVVASGQPSTVELTQNPPVGGTIAYFGRPQLTRENGYSLVVDARLPGWVRAEISKALPRIIAHIGKKLGHELPIEPVIYLPFSSSNRRFGLTHSGAVVGHQMILALFGERWSLREEETKEDLLKLLAHEAFHLWNSSLFLSLDRPGGRWLHEGSADAFAYLSLHETGLITKTRFDELRTIALNRCMLGLSGADLPSSRGVLGARNHYDCGSVIHELLGVALRSRSEDIWSLWKGIFDRARHSDSNVYSHEDFFEVANSTTESSGVIDSIRVLTDGRRPTGEALSLEPFLVSAFSSAGSPLAIDDNNWPYWYRKLAGERAIVAALEADCDGESYFVDEKPWIKLVGGSWCEHLKTDKKIHAIGKHRLWKGGVDAYDFIRSTCLAAPKLLIGNSKDDEQVYLNCPHLPPRPRFLRYSW